MFKFSTNTILNCTATQLVMDTEGNVKVSKNWRSKDYNNAKLAGVEHEWLSIERLGTFRKGNVTKIFRRDAVKGAAGKVVITCATANFNSYGLSDSETAGIYRLLLYIKLSGSNDSYFANDFVFKGKPLAYEFELEANKTATDLAKGLADAILKETRRFGSKYIKASASGTSLTIEAVGPDACYELFTQAELQKFDSNLNSALTGGDYRKVTGATVVNTPCQNPFGTYWQIMKDLRLPTADALRFGAIVADDRPALDGEYAQFIIYMCVDRGIMGGDAVGEITKSVTAHSIWVPQACAAAFHALLKLYTDVEPEWHDADYKRVARSYVDSQGVNWSNTAPWNGKALQEATGASLTDQDALDVTKGEAYAGVNLKEAETEENQENP